MAIVKNGIGLLLLMLALSACGKKDKTPPATEKLQQGSWQLKSWTSRRVFRNESTEANQYALTDACIRDNRYTFGADGRLQLDEGATRCSAGDVQNRDAGPWQLTGDDQQLRSNILGYPSTATIEELTETALQLTADTTFYFGNETSRLILTARFER